MAIWSRAASALQRSGSARPHLRAYHPFSFYQVLPALAACWLVLVLVRCEARNAGTAHCAPTGHALARLLLACCQLSVVSEERGIPTVTRACRTLPRFWADTVWP